MTDMPGIFIDLYSDMLRRIVRYIDEEENMDHIPQPMFIVGQSGAGKSTLLRLLADRLEERGLSETVQFFDGKQFFNSHDIIRAIEGVDYDGSMPIGENAGQKRRIVVIDDLDYFFKRSDLTDQYLLRNYLNCETSPLIVATISEIDDSLADYRAPFFEGVRLIYIPPLDNSMISALEVTDETQRRLLALMEYLPPVINSLKLAYDIILISGGEDADVHELVSSVAPFYRKKLVNLPVYSQKILHAIAMSDSAVTLAELRELTGLPAGTLSSYLRQLVKSGEIRKTVSRKRDVPYAICNNLFRLWLASKAM